MDHWILYRRRRRNVIEDEIQTKREAIDYINTQINKLEEQREEGFFRIDALEAEYKSLELFPKKKVNHAV